MNINKEQAEQIEELITMSGESIDEIKAEMRVILSDPWQTSMALLEQTLNINKEDDLSQAISRLALNRQADDLINLIAVTAQRQATHYLCQGSRAA